MAWKLFDTHCHVHFPAYDGVREEVLERARESGTAMVLVGTMESTSRSAIAMAERFPEGVYAAIGLHPCHTYAEGHEDPAEGERHHAHEAEHFDAATYMAMAQHPKVVAIGETGLDFYRLTPGLEQQQRDAEYQSLRAHFTLATEVRKPVVLHCREAHAELLAEIDAALERGELPARGIIHCFTGNAEQALAYVLRGFYISFSGVITFPVKKSKPAEQEALWAAVRAVPLAQLLVETDAPYLAPMPHRGERNEPALVRYTVEKVAELKGIYFEEVAKVTTENAQRVFKTKNAC